MTYSLSFSMCPKALLNSWEMSAAGFLCTAFLGDTSVLSSLRASDARACPVTTASKTGQWTVLQLQTARTKSAIIRVSRLLTQRRELKFAATRYKTKNTSQQKFYIA